MKYFAALLILVGFVGVAYAQDIGEPEDGTWLPACKKESPTGCDQSSLFHSAISEPFAQSDSVVVGTVIQKEQQEQNTAQFSISVDFYLKNYLPFGLLTATLTDATEPESSLDVHSYNSPNFDEGDLVFAYLKKSGGHYALLPTSFALDKHEVRGPPPITLLMNSPIEDNFVQGDKIPVSGEIRKMDLVKAANDGRKLGVKVSLIKPDDRKNTAFSDMADMGPDGNYNYVLDTSKIPPGNYELEVNYGPSTTGDRIRVEPNWGMWTPLKQIHAGIPFDEMQCKEDLVLLQKYDGSPACVNQDTIPKLIQRGWINVEHILDAEKKIPKLLCELYGGGFSEEGTGECVGLESPDKCHMLGGAWDGKCIVPEMIGKGIKTEPDPEPKPISEKQQLERQKQKDALASVEKTLQTDYRANEIKIKAINDYVDEYEPDYFMKQFLYALKNEYKKDDLINFVFTEWGYQSQECTSPMLKIYLKPYDSYSAFGSIEKIYEWQKSNYCESLEPYSEGYLILNYWRMLDIPQQYQRCTVPGEYKIFASSMNDENPEPIGSFTCQKDRLVGQPQPWMELPE